MQPARTKTELFSKEFGPYVTLFDIFISLVYLRQSDVSADVIFSKFLIYFKIENYTLV